MSRKTTIWHVTPESNIDQIEEHGLQPASVGIETWIGGAKSPERVTEGVYVCRTQRAIRSYAQSCLGDVLNRLDNDEGLALYRAKVDVDRLTSDPESDRNPHEPDAWIHVDAIPDPELVETDFLSDE
jgi:hypothetical protein